MTAGRGIPKDAKGTTRKSQLARGRRERESINALEPNPVRPPYAVDLLADSCLALPALETALRNHWDWGRFGGIMPQTKGDSGADQGGGIHLLLVSSSVLLLRGLTRVGFGEMREAMAGCGYRANRGVDILCGVLLFSSSGYFLIASSSAPRLGLSPPSPTTLQAAPRYHDEPCSTRKRVTLLLLFFFGPPLNQR